MTQFTPAARAALEEYLEGRARDVRREVLRRAEFYASSRDGETLITAQSVAAAISDVPTASIGNGSGDIVWALSSTQRRMRLARRIASIYLAVGSLLAVVGSIAVVALIPKGDALSLPLTAALTAAGALTQVTGVVVYTWVRRRELWLARTKASRTNLIGSYLRHWSAFEQALRSVDAKGAESARTLSSALNLAASVGAFSRDDYTEAQRLLRVRNSIVHSGSLTGPDDLSEDITSLQILTLKLKPKSKITPSELGIPETE